MGSSLDNILQGLNIDTASEAGSPTAPAALGPRGGQLDSHCNPEARKAPLNAALINGLPTLHKFRRPDAAANGIKNEQPWHRMAAYMLLAGRRNSEIAAAAGVTSGTVTVLRSQRWFQELLAVLANETGQDITGILQSEAAASVETLVAIRDDPEASARVRLSAAQTLLEQAHGKPTQKIVQSVNHSNLKPEDELQGILNELEMLRKRER